MKQVFVAFLLLAGPTPASADVQDEEEPLVFTSSSGHVQSPVLSADGRKLCGVCIDGKVATWDVQKGLQTDGIAAMPQARGPFAISPDGKIVAGCHSTDGVVLWDGKKTVKLAPPQVAGNLKHVIFSPDGKRVALAIFQGAIGVFEVPSGKSIIAFTSAGAEYRSIHFSKDGRKLASAGDQRILELFDLSKEKAYGAVTGTGDLTAVVLRPDGKRLIAANCAGEITMWNCDTRKPIWTATARSNVKKMALSLDDTKLVTMDVMGSIKIWDPQTGTEIGGLEPPRGTDDIVISPDSKKLLTFYSSRVYVWTFDKAVVPVVAAHKGQINALELSATGKQAFTAGDDGLVKAWDLENRSELRAMSGHQGRVTCVAVSPDGKLIASGGEDKTLRLWDADGKPIRSMTGHREAVLAAAFTLDGRRVVSGSADSSVRIWSVESGTCETTLKDHKDAVRSIAVRPLNGLVATASVDGEVLLWDPATWKEPKVLADAGGRLKLLAFSGDGMRLYWSGPAPGGYDFETGGMVGAVEMVENCTALAVGEKGPAAAGGESGVIRWFAAKPVEFRGHTGAVRVLRLAPAVKRLVSGGADGTLRYWSIESGAASNPAHRPYRIVVDIG